MLFIIKKISKKRVQCGENNQIYKDNCYEIATVSLDRSILQVQHKFNMQ